MLIKFRLSWMDSVSKRKKKCHLNGQQSVKTSALNHKNIVLQPGKFNFAPLESCFLRIIFLKSTVLI